MKSQLNTAVNPRIDRSALFDRDGVLCIYRKPLPPKAAVVGQPGSRSVFVATEPEPFIALTAEGRIFAFNGHVDLGTGIRTALSQIVADELDVDMARIEMVLGSTSDVPNQGPTIASASIQVSAQPLRKAAAQARQALLQCAAEHLGMDSSALIMNEGVITARDHSPLLEIPTLLKGRRILLELDENVSTRPSSELKWVGKEIPRVDIPAKVMGEAVYVHDVRVPGMLHGRVIRPPYPGREAHVLGQSLVDVDRSSVEGIKGLVDVVVLGDFVGVVAEREEQAILAAEKLRCHWRQPPALVNLESDLEESLRAIPAIYRPLKSTGDVSTALASINGGLARTYLWPYQLHGSIGPSCAVADWSETAEGPALKVWSGTQNPHSLRADLALLTELEEPSIAIIRYEASGCYGRNCADDVCADAALLSRAVGKPVRVQLSRRDEHGWEPKGAAQIIDVTGGELPSGELAYDLLSRYPSNDSPTLALVLTGKVPAEPGILEMGDRTAVPPYRVEHLRTACDDVPPPVRASWLRGVAALPNVFAHESFMDELAYRADCDPIEYRLRYLIGERPCDLLRKLRDFSQWQSRRSGPTDDIDDLDENAWLKGRGMAYAHYSHGKFPGVCAAMAAVSAEIAVCPASGALRVERIHLVHDAGQIVNPTGIRHQVHGNIVQTLSRVLWEKVSFGPDGTESLEWGGYPIMDFTELPEIHVELVEPPDAPPLGVGESASLPIAPAIANALFDATGLCFRRPPFIPETIRQAFTEAKRISMEGIPG